MLAPILIAGKWQAAHAGGTFQVENPAKTEMLPEEYPISTWGDCEAALDAATWAFEALQNLPPETTADFLEAYAATIERHVDELAKIASIETGLPISPRLKVVELPRTTDQLRQSAVAVRDGSWALPTIDPQHNLRSCYAAMGPVFVLGPNNFPFAYEGIAGGDFAAAIAIGCPVIGKAHPSHPGTSRSLAELAQQAADQTGLPPGSVQMIYHLQNEDGLRMVADRRLGATAYTGSRSAGLVLKAVADVAGKPIYLELSSINPVILLPGALCEHSDEIANEFTKSCLSAVGQFCTNPGLILLLASDETEKFIANVSRQFQSAPVGTLLSSRVHESLGQAITTLQQAGAKLVVGGKSGGGAGYSYANTLLRVSAAEFIKHSAVLQTEAFGNESLLVVAQRAEELETVVRLLNGNLTGSIYSSAGSQDNALYNRLAPILRLKVGRMLNDKMPTGVTVSPAMNHGGPYPATGHPGFTAVGVPAAMRRFAMLQCFDHVRPERLPPLLKDKNPTGHTWRLIDGSWTTADVHTAD